MSALLRLASIYPQSLFSSMPLAAWTLPLPFCFLGPRYRLPSYTAHLVPGDRIHTLSRQERKLKLPRGWASLHSAPTVPRLGLSSTLQETQVGYHLSGSCQSFYRRRFSKRHQRYLLVECRIAANICSSDSRLKELSLVLVRVQLVSKGKENRYILFKR